MVISDPCPCSIVESMNCLYIFSFPINCSTYLCTGQLIGKWSKTLIAGPHLSGLESFGHRVTDGKSTPLIDLTNVLDLTG